MADDVLLYFGGEVKALGDNKVGGYLVRYSDETQPDLHGDFFTKDTEFYIDPGDTRFVIYEHGFDETLKRSSIGKGVLVKTDDVGLWVEAQLKIREDYEKMLDEKGRKKLNKYLAGIYKMAQDGKLGWSSGAAGHLVTHKPTEKACWLSEWGIAEFSLTPRPAEHQNKALALKSYQGMLRAADMMEDEEDPDYVDDDEEDDTTKKKKKPMMKRSLAQRLTQYVDDLVDDGRDRPELIKAIAQEAITDPAEIEKILKGETRRPSAARLKAFARVLGISYDALKDAAGDQSLPKTIKGMFEEQLTEQGYSYWQLSNIYCEVVRKLAMAAAGSNAAGSEFDVEGKLAEASTEYQERLSTLILAQIEEYIESGADREFYLKSILKLSEDDFRTAKNIEISDHSDMVVTALKEIVARYRSNHEARKNQKAGRVLSEKNRQRLMTMLDGLQAAVTDCQKLLEESMPMASDEEKRAVLSQRMRLEHRARMAGLHLS